MLIGTNEAAQLAGITYEQIKYLKEVAFIHPTHSSPGKDYYSFDQIVMLHALNLLKKRHWSELVPMRDFLQQKLSQGKIKPDDRVAIVGSLPMIITPNMKANSLFEEDVQALQIRILPPWVELEERIKNHPIMLRREIFESIGA